ncbi:MAG: hypothetical protein ACE5MI_13440 [Acidimicrobiia bacterium]
MQATKRIGVRALVVGLFLAYLAVQVAVPAWLLTSESGSPVRGGWQMFSAPTPAPEFIVVDSDGSEDLVILEQFVAFPRGDLPLESALPAHLCLVLPSAEAIIVSQAALVVCP